jgi:hypothetical protein
MNLRKSKIFSSLLVLLMILTVLPQAALSIMPDYVLSSNSPTDQGDSIILSITNNTGSDIIISGWISIDFNGNEDTLLTGEHLYDVGNGGMTIAAGTTSGIAEIAPGAPGTWRGFYGEGPYTIKITVNLNDVPWESNEINHTVIVPSFEPGEVAGGSALFISDNEDGTATLLVTAEDVNQDPVEELEAEEFVIGVHDSDPLQELGTIIDVTETEPGVYEVVWAYDDGIHSIDILVSGRPVAYGLAVTISTLPEGALRYVEGIHVSSLDGRDDSTDGPFNNGFNFPFYGVNQTQFYVTTNGVVSFGGASSAYGNTTLPTSNYNYPAVFPFWDDLHPSPGYSDINGYILYKTIAAGRYGNPYGVPVVVVQWTNYGYYSSSLVHGTFQVHLVADGRIVFNYNDLIEPTRAYGQSATIGIQQSGSGSALQHSYNTDAGIRNGYTIRFNYDSGTGGYTNLGASADGFWNMLLYKDNLPPGKPENPSPGVGAAVSASPTLSWSAASEADDYRVVVSTNSNLNSPVYNQVVSGTSTTVSGLSADTTYYWQVVARNASGQTPSDLWHFETTSAAPPPPGPSFYTLNIAKSGEGSTNPPQSTYQHAAGTTIALVAEAAEGWEFVRWVVSGEEFAGANIYGGAVF